MNEEQVKELFSDEAFVASILEMETSEEVQKAFSDRGLDLSLDEIEIIKNSLSNEETELSEDDLETVTGGIRIAGIDKLSDHLIVAKRRF